MSRYSDDRIDLEDLIRTRLNRRQALKLGALAPAAAGLVAACGGSPSHSSTSPVLDSSRHPGPVTMSVANTPRHQTVVLEQGTFTVFDSFNPFIPKGVDYANGFGEICMEYLWYLNFATGKITPWLATGYHYSRNYTRFEMTLDPKAHWSDGHPFTSKDIKFTIEMLQKYPVLLNSSFVDQEAKQVSTPNDNEVVIDLTAPDARYHYDLICNIVNGFRVMPEHLWSSQDPTKYKFNPPILTGPYTLKQAYPDQMMLVWERDPNYWNRDKMSPAPKYAVYRTAPTPDSDLQQFRAATVDESAAKWQAVSSLVAQRTPNLVATTMWDPCPHYFAVNCHPSKGLLADSRMRQALSYLVDREKISNVLYEPSPNPAVFPWAPFAQNRKWENNKIAAQWATKYNPSKAARILDQLGATKGSDGKRSYQGKPLNYLIATNAAAPDPNYLTCQLFQSELKGQGIDSTIVVDIQNYSNRFQEGNYDISLQWLCAEAYDPFQVYTLFSGAQGIAAIGQKPLVIGQNNERFQSDEYDHLLSQLASVDPTSSGAKPLYDQMLNEFFKQMPIIMINQMLDGFSNNTTWWTGWPTNNKGDLYITPNNWWGQFLFVMGRLKPTGKM